MLLVRLASVTGGIDSDTGSAWKQLRDKSPTLDYLFAPGKRYSVELRPMDWPGVMASLAQVNSDGGDNGQHGPISAESQTLNCRTK